MADAMPWVREDAEQTCFKEKEATQILTLLMTIFLFSFFLVSPF